MRSREGAKRDAKEGGERTGGEGERSLFLSESETGTQLVY